MEAYLKEHEAFIRGRLGSAGGDVDWADLDRFHRTRIEWLQHERLVHLLVTLFFGGCTLLTLLSLVVHPQLGVSVLLLLLLVLLVPYVAHYYRLENGVQRWYRLAGEIEVRAGHARRDDGDGSAGPGNARS